MTNSFNAAKGVCLCGAVTVEAKTVDPHLGACHCDMCRQWGGGPYISVECKEGVTFDGEDNITRYDSSEWAERAFCSKCGTHLYYRFKANNSHFMPAGLFKEHPEFDLDHQIFIDEKPNYYDFANQTQMLTGEEVQAFFSGSQEQ